MLTQVNNNIQFTIEKVKQDYLFRCYDKQKWCKNLDGYSQETSRLKKICPIDVKPFTALFNKYTILSCKKNMYHC